MMTELERDKLVYTLDNSKDIIGSLSKVWETMKLLSVFVLKVSMYYLMKGKIDYKWYQLGKIINTLKVNWDFLKAVWDLTGDFINDLKAIWGKELHIKL